MAVLRVPINFEQFSTHMDGKLTINWYDSTAVTSVSDLSNTHAGGDVTAFDLSNATASITFSSKPAQSNVVDLLAMTNGTTGVGLTVPDDYNKAILVEMVLEANCGVSSSATTFVKKTIQHQFDGLSDSTLTSTPANPTFTETEIVGNTRKSLGSFSVNDADSGATYTANVTYDKAVGSITYSDTSIVTSNPGNDHIVTSSVSTLNTVLSDMQYLPTYRTSPPVNQDAIRSQTITVSLENTVDKRINGQPVTTNATVNNTLSFSRTGTVPNFSEAEAVAGTRKSLGTFALTPVLTYPSTTFTATVTYDHANASIVYPDASIVTTFENVDTISTTNVTDFNNALTNATYLPTIISVGDDDETIVSQSVDIAVSSNPQLTIATPTVTVTPTVDTLSTQIGEMQMDDGSAVTGFRYQENRRSVLNAGAVTDAMQKDYEIIDTTEANALYALVFDTEQDLGEFEISSTTTSAINYAGTGQAAGISTNAFIVQGTKSDLNILLEGNELADPNNIFFYPDDEQTGSSNASITLYRAPSGTSASIDINSNLSTFRKIFSHEFVLSNYQTATTFALDSLTASGSAGGTIELPNGTISMTARGDKQITLTVTTDSTLPSGTGSGDFGTITTDLGGTETFSNKTYTFTGNTENVNVRLDALKYRPPTGTTGTVNLTIGVEFASGGDGTPEYSDTVVVTVT